MLIAIALTYVDLKILGVLRTQHTASCIRLFRFWQRVKSAPQPGYDDSWLDKAYMTKTARGICGSEIDDLLAVLAPDGTSQVAKDF